MEGMKNTKVVQYLEKLCKTPSTSFHEHRMHEAVKEAACGLLNLPGVSMHEDCYGNMIIRYKADNAKNSIAFAAHTDHPGFELTRVEEGIAEADILGLINDEILCGAGVKIISSGREVDGVIEETGGGMVKISYTSETMPKEGDYAVFDLERFKIEDDRIKGTALDDLAGCAISLAALEKIADKGIKVNTSAVFHRAEEVGFLGALAVISGGIIPKDTHIVSVECSSQLPEAVLGNGAAIREGDAMFYFDRNAELYLQIAKDVLEKQGIMVQSARMYGGTCEGTAYFANGYPTTAVALPTANLHNDGGTNIVEEEISIYDLNSAVALLTTATAVMSQFKENSTRLRVRGSLGIMLEKSMGRLKKE